MDSASESLQEPICATKPRHTLRAAVKAGEWLYGQSSPMTAKHARWNLPVLTESIGRLYGYDCQKWVASLRFNYRSNGQQQTIV